ncbi:MAG TPA: TRAP transporter small permease [Syntrophales bacterium]|mgnify:CR=1 FL=1|jgi:TRAP-type C4-dicarboxylate transport system permease small subunit|nr:TRAP transporter small permease [Syntrophales bacterium]
MTPIAVFSKLNETLIKAASGVTAAALAVIAVVIPYEVFGRYVLGDMPVWSGEAATFSLVWASMMGSAVGLKQGYQVSLNLLMERLPRGPYLVVTGCMYAGMLVFLGLMTWFGMHQTLVNMHQLSTAIQIPMGFPYLALPVGFLIMFLITAEQCWRFFLPGSKGG